MQTLNIGLASNKRPALHNAAPIVDWLLASGRRLGHARVAQSASEPTLVVSVDRALNAAEAYALCAAFEQDCIAQSADGKTGELLGPNAAQWAPFNPQYFIGLK